MDKSPKLLDMVRDVMQTKHYSIKTEKSYLRCTLLVNKLLPIFRSQITAAHLASYRFCERLIVSVLRLSVEAIPLPLPSGPSLIKFSLIENAKMLAAPIFIVALGV